MSTTITAPAIGSPAPTQAAAAPPAIPAAQPAGEDVAALKAKLAELEGAVQESQRMAQHWYEQRAKPAKEATPTPEVEEEDVLDAITSRGEKGFEAVAKKRGFIQRAEVIDLVEKRATAAIREADLVTQYPDLKNKKSEFFQATALHYGELRKRGVPEAEAMELGAEKAELEFIRAGKIKSPAQVAEAAQAARRDRAAAGAGERGVRSAAPEEEDDTPTPDETRAIQHLADALEIPIEKATERYKARAKSGVNVALKMGGR